MRATWVEESVYRWFEEEFRKPEGLAEEVYLHRPGAMFPERNEVWIYPRIDSYTPAVAVRPRRGEQHGQLSLVVSCHVKNPPGGREDLLELSKLEDSVRAVIDAGFRAGAAKILDGARRTVGVVDFGVATALRTYQESVSVGGITVPGVDSSVLTVACEISPVKPRVKPLHPGGQA